MFLLAACYRITFKYWICWFEASVCIEGLDTNDGAQLGVAVPALRSRQLISYFFSLSNMIDIEKEEHMIER